MGAGIEAGEFIRHLFENELGSLLIFSENFNLIGK